MTLIDFGDFKIRFDPKEVRISIDGEIIDIGARRIVTNGKTELEDHEKLTDEMCESFRKKQLGH